jgi:hypothetical protein
MNHFHISGDAVRDYSLAGVLITTPVWVQYLQVYATPLLTFVCVLTGAILGIRRVIRDFKHPQQD